MVINLDNFSKINEVFGHEFGDECLKDVGKVLRNVFRSSDIIGRVDRNEFFVFIGNHKTLDFVEKKTNELCAALYRTYEKDGGSVALTASIGISLYPEHGDEFESVYEKANKALQKAKHNGMNCVVIYDEDME